MSEIIITLERFEDIESYLQADAFLIGNEQTAVRIASHFSFDLMREIISKVHSLQKKIYLNFSKIFTESEIKDLEKNFNIIMQLDFDGILYSDFAIQQLAMDNHCLHKLIYASETQIVNHFDILSLQTLGVDKFIVSKEMTFENIVETSHKTKVKIGMLAFGHYGMFYSKRKLISNFISEYQIQNITYENQTNLTIQEKTRREMMPLMQNQNGTTVFSSDIMCAIEEVPALVKAGVQYFIIDSIFLNQKQSLSILQLFVASIKNNTIHSLSDVSLITGIKNLSKGFLHKKIGLK